MIQEKFDNFKAFVEDISHNQEIVQEYQDMSWLKLQALAYVLLLPQKHNLEEIVKEMQHKLDFDDEHVPKFRRYMDLFVEYLEGEQTPDYLTSQEMPFEERQRLYMEEQERRNL